MKTATKKTSTKKTSTKKTSDTVKLTIEGKLVNGSIKKGECRDILDTKNNIHWFGIPYSAKPKHFSRVATDTNYKDNKAKTGQSTKTETMEFINRAEITEFIVGMFRKGMKYSGTAGQMQRCVAILDSAGWGYGSFDSTTNTRFESDKEFRAWQAEKAAKAKAKK